MGYWFSTEKSYISLIKNDSFEFLKTKPKLTEVQKNEFGTNSVAIYTLKKIQNSFISPRDKAYYAQEIYQNLTSKYCVKIAIAIHNYLSSWFFKGTADRIKEAAALLEKIKADKVSYLEAANEENSVNPDLLIEEKEGLDGLFPEVSSNYSKYDSPETNARQKFKEACSVGAKEENARLNRYSNSLPFDTNRVKLHNRSEESDYINASADSRWNKKLILSQGPLDETLNDHWKMIWDEGVERAFRFTKGIENGRLKCEDYDVGTFGEITSTATCVALYTNKGEVLFIEDPNELYLFNLANAKGGYKPEKPEEFKEYLETEENSEDQLKEEFRISALESLYGEEGILGFVVTVNAKKGEETRTIKIDHFNVWPDHGVPVERAKILFLECVERVCSLLEQNKAVLLHCSAGIGRTGVVWTLVDLMKDAVDGIRKRWKPKEKPNVNQTILKGRKNVRAGLVQTDEQRQFIIDSYPELLSSAYLIADGKSWLDPEWKKLRKNRRPAVEESESDEYDEFPLF